jgi:hypothetical protein
MKRLYKCWNTILILIMGILGASCIHEPEPEYGVYPMYGVPAAFRPAINPSEQNNTKDELIVKPVSDLQLKANEFGIK